MSSEEFTDIFNEPGNLVDAQFESCPSCGNNLTYSAENKSIHCNHCGFNEEANQANDEIIEQELRAALDKLSNFTPDLTDAYAYHCDNCGANILIDSSQVKLECGFCASDKVNKTALMSNYINPIGIIPFYINRSEAERQFTNWIRRGWFHPSKLGAKSVINNLHGIYIPFWTFDAHTEATWSGQAGQYYYQTQRIRVNGRMQTTQTRKVRWTHRSGKIQHFFDDITVAGSDKLNQNSVQRILPYRLDEAVNFDARLLLGWETEMYNIELDKAYLIGDGIMDFKLRHMCSAQLGGDVQRNLHVNSSKRDQTFKLLILPLWISSYKYQNKIYQFLINGQTGRVHGKKPISWVKIVVLVILFLALFVGLYFLRESGVFN